MRFRRMQSSTDIGPTLTAFGLHTQVFAGASLGTIADHRAQATRCTPRRTKRNSFSFVTRCGWCLCEMSMVDDARSNVAHVAHATTACVRRGLGPRVATKSVRLRRLRRPHSLAKRCSAATHRRLGRTWPHVRARCMCPTHDDEFLPGGSPRVAVEAAHGRSAPVRSQSRTRMLAPGVTPSRAHASHGCISRSSFLHTS